MLSVRKSITLTGECLIDGVKAEGYTAVINSANPLDMTLSSYQHNKELCKANRQVCRADEAAFEDMAYAIQDEMLAEKEAAGEPNIATE